jgi:hypothetical protein
MEGPNGPGGVRLSFQALPAGGTIPLAAIAAMLLHVKAASSKAIQTPRHAMRPAAQSTRKHSGTVAQSARRHGGRGSQEAQWHMLPCVEIAKR